VSNEAFIEIEGDYIRVDAITRLSTRDVAGVPGVPQQFVHLSDGASIYLSEVDYRRVYKALSGAKDERKTKKGA
jgi:hypothetical protein